MITVNLGIIDIYKTIKMQPLSGFGVGKVVDSRNPGFKKGDLVWGTTGWEEYTLIKSPRALFKIHHTDVPLSYYTGILGEFLNFLSFDFT